MHVAVARTDRGPRLDDREDDVDAVGGGARGVVQSSAQRGAGRWMPGVSTKMICVSPSVSMPRIA